MATIKDSANWASHQAYPSDMSMTWDKIELRSQLRIAFQKGARWQKSQMFKDCVIVECSVRVYPTLDDKPRPWVALYKNGIGCNSLRDIPELENIGFKDNDTAIVIIKRKEDGQ